MYSLYRLLCNVWHCVFAEYPFILEIVKIFVTYLITNFTSEIWVISHCLVLGHEAMLCAFYVLISWMLLYQKNKMFPRKYLSRTGIYWSVERFCLNIGSCVSNRGIIIFSLWQMWCHVTSIWTNIKYRLQGFTNVSGFRHFNNYLVCMLCRIFSRAYTNYTIACVSARNDICHCCTCGPNV